MAVAQAQTGKSTTGKPLPDPDDHPGSEIVIWDGHCVFCRKQVQRLRAFDLTGRLSFISLHDQRVLERYPDLTCEQLMDQMWVVSPKGGRFGGADAIRYLSLRMPLLWPAVPLLYFPFAMPLWRAMYRWVAQRRYRIAGKDCEGGSCKLHIKP